MGNRLFLVIVLGLFALQQIASLGTTLWIKEWALQSDLVQDLPGEELARTTGESANADEIVKINPWFYITVYRTVLFIRIGHDYSRSHHLPRLTKSIILHIRKTTRLGTPCKASILRQCATGTNHQSLLKRRRGNGSSHTGIRNQCVTTSCNNNNGSCVYIGGTTGVPYRRGVHLCGVLFRSGYLYQRSPGSQAN